MSPIHYSIVRLLRLHNRQRKGEKLCIGFNEQRLPPFVSVNLGLPNYSLPVLHQSLGYRHDSPRHYQILDVDLTGLPCGKKAALATKGYFAGARNRRGRQLGRVLATRYQEVVVDQLFEGRKKLTEALVPLVQAAEDLLELDAAKRARMLLRVDAGGGSLDDVNWALSQGYQILCKEYSGQRARLLAASVKA